MRPPTGFGGSPGPPGAPIASLTGAEASGSASAPPELAFDSRYEPPL